MENTSCYISSASCLHLSESANLQTHSPVYRALCGFLTRCRLSSGTSLSQACELAEGLLSETLWSSDFQPGFRMFCCCPSSEQELRGFQKQVWLSATTGSPSSEGVIWVRDVADQVSTCLVVYQQGAEFHPQYYKNTTKNIFLIKR